PGLSWRSPACTSSRTAASSTTSKRSLSQPPGRTTTSASKLADEVTIVRQRWTRLECEPLEDRITPATLTWTGAVDGLWSHAGNWSTTDMAHPVPQAGDNIVLPQGAANTNQTDDLGLITLGSITFNDEGYTISGDGLILTGGINVNP